MFRGYISPRYRRDTSTSRRELLRPSKALCLPQLLSTQTFDPVIRPVPEMGALTPESRQSQSFDRVCKAVERHTYTANQINKRSTTDGPSKGCFKNVENATWNGIVNFTTTSKYPPSSFLLPHGGSTTLPHQGDTSRLGGTVGNPWRKLSETHFTSFSKPCPAGSTASTTTFHISITPERAAFSKTSASRTLLSMAFFV